MDCVTVDRHCGSNAQCNHMRPGEKLRALLSSGQYGTASQLARAMGMKAGHNNVAKWMEGRGFDNDHRTSVQNRRAVEKHFGLPDGYFEASNAKLLEPINPVEQAAPTDESDVDVYPSRTQFVGETPMLPDERKHIESLWYQFGDPGPREWSTRLKSYRRLKEQAGAARVPANLARPRSHGQATKRR